MPDLTYPSIQPLVVSTLRVGHRVHCLFRCPVTGTEVSSCAALPAETQGGEKARPAGFWPWIRLGVLAAVQRAMAREELTAPPELSEEGLRGAIVVAFQAVAGYFRWNGTAWVARDAEDIVSEFTRHLKCAPLSNYDRSILARILCRLAPGDGVIGPEERALMEEFVAGDNREPVTRAELSATTPGRPREVILLLAWTLAFSDERLELREVEELEATALGLDLDPERAQEIRRLAQLYVVNLGMARAYHAGKLDQEVIERVTALARNIGIDLRELSSGGPEARPLWPPAT